MTSRPVTIAAKRALIQGLIICVSFSAGHVSAFIKQTSNTMLISISSSSKAQLVILRMGEPKGLFGNIELIWTREDIVRFSDSRLECDFTGFDIDRLRVRARLGGRE